MLLTNEKLLSMVPGVLRGLQKENYFLDCKQTELAMEGLTLNSVTQDGNFTVVVVSMPHGASYMGISKRHPKDDYSKVRGVCLAASRAIRQAALALAHNYATDVRINSQLE
jgi:hypothetical protein